MKLRLVLLALLLVAPAWATEPKQPDPLPASLTVNDSKPVTVEVGHKCVLTATTGAKKVTWKIPAGVETLAIDGKRLAVWATEGTYTFQAAVPNGDDVILAEIVLTVTGPRPPPAPPDAFVKALQDAWALETPADKARIADLAAIYRVSATKPSGTIYLAANDTGKKVHDVFKSARDAFMQGALPNVIEAIRQHQNAELTIPENKPLDDATRDKIAASFMRFARSAPEKPGVRSAITVSFTSGPIGLVRR